MEFIYKKYISYCVWIYSSFVTEDLLYWSLYKINKFLIIYKCVHLMSQRRIFSVLEVIYKIYISYCVSMCSPFFRRKGLTFYFNMFNFCHRKELTLYWSLYTVYTYRILWLINRSGTQVDFYNLTPKCCTRGLPCR